MEGTSFGRDTSQIWKDWETPAVIDDKGELKMTFGVEANLWVKVADKMFSLGSVTLTRQALSAEPAFIFNSSTLEVLEITSMSWEIPSSKEVMMTVKSFDGHSVGRP